MTDEPMREPDYEDEEEMHREMADFLRAAAFLDGALANEKGIDAALDDIRQHIARSFDLLRRMLDMEDNYAMILRVRPDMAVAVAEKMEEATKELRKTLVNVLGEPDNDEEP
jgi:hypothetical protein